MVGKTVSAVGQTEVWIVPAFGPQDFSQLPGIQVHNVGKLDFPAEIGFQLAELFFGEPDSVGAGQGVQVVFSQERGVLIYLVTLYIACIAISEFCGPGVLGIPSHNVPHRAIIVFCQGIVLEGHFRNLFPGKIHEYGIVGHGGQFIAAVVYDKVCIRDICTAENEAIVVPRGGFLSSVGIVAYPLADRQE